MHPLHSLNVQDERFGVINDRDGDVPNQGRLFIERQIIYINLRVRRLVGG